MFWQGLPPFMYANEKHTPPPNIAPRMPDYEPSQTSVLAGERLRRNYLATLTFSASFGTSLILLAVGYALGIDVLRLLAVTGALFFGVGTAPLQLSESASVSLRLCVAGLIGLALPLIVASVMVLTPLWQPVLTATIVAIAAVSVHIIACRRILSDPLRGEILHTVRNRDGNPLDASVVCSLGGTLLWSLAVLRIGHVVPGVLGFLPKVSIFWYLGLVLLIVGIMLSRGKDESRAIFGVVSLLAALTLTPSIAYGMPRSQSAAKHIDLVQAILQTHYLNRGGRGILSSLLWFFLRHCLDKQHLQHARYYRHSNLLAIFYRSYRAGTAEVLLWAPNLIAIPDLGGNNACHPS